MRLFSAAVERETAHERLSEWNKLLYFLSDY